MQVCFCRSEIIPSTAYSNVSLCWRGWLRVHFRLLQQGRHTELSVLRKVIIGQTTSNAVLRHSTQYRHTSMLSTIVFYLSIHTATQLSDSAFMFYAKHLKRTVPDTTWHWTGIERLLLVTLVAECGQWHQPEDHWWFQTGCLTIKPSILHCFWAILITLSIWTNLFAHPQPSHCICKARHVTGHVIQVLIKHK